MRGGEEKSERGESAKARKSKESTNFSLLE